MRGVGSPFGVQSPFGKDQSVFVPPVITATAPPSLGTLTDGDQVQDAYTAGSGYASSANGGAAAIVSVVTTVTINGSTGALTDVVAFSDVVSVTVTVTDDQTPANERQFFAGSQTVASLVQPFALTLSGNTLTGTGLSLTLTGNILEAA